MTESEPSRATAFASDTVATVLRSVAIRAAAAESAAALGLGVNAGHDLTLSNLPLFRELPHLAEVSIGHALMSHALYVGLEQSVRDYLDALR